MTAFVVVPSTVETLNNFAEELLRAVVVALASTPEGAPSRTYVSPGIPVIDCEQATVHVETVANDTISPNSPPTQIGHQFATGLWILGTLVVTTARCVPVAKTRGNVIELPTPESLGEAAKALNADLWAMFNTIVTLKDRGELFGGRCRTMYVDQAVPIETAGGFGGWTFTVRPVIDGYFGAADDYTPEA